MALTVAQMDQLEARLAFAASNSRATDTALLRQAAIDSPHLRDPLLAQAVAHLSAHLHHPPSAHARTLARGAIVVALNAEVVPATPSDVETVVEFALSRLDDLSKNGTGHELDEESRGKALALLDRCCTLPEGDDSRLIELTSAFIDSTARLAEGVLFARMLDDLRFLANALQERTRTPGELRTVRGALAYFAERDDAISDDLGIVGILDDAFIARLVRERLEPEQRSRNIAIDMVLGRWPLLQHLRLTTDSHAGSWTPSVVTILNLGASLLGEAASRSAIVTPQTARLGLLLGTVAALCRIYEHARRATTFQPEPGTYIAPVGRPTEVCRVVRYEAWGNQSGIKVAYLPEHGPEVVRWRPLAILERYVVAPPPTRRRRTTLKDTDKAALELGPLERLFGLERPVQCPRADEMIALVGPFAASRDVLERTRLYGRSLASVLPWGRLDEDGEVTGATPGDPVLVFTRRCSDAAAALERASRRLHVLAPIDAPDRDENAVDRLIEQGACVTAIVPQRNFETQDYLRQRRFRFLDWVAEMLPTGTPEGAPSGTKHPFARCEADLVQAVRSKAEIRIAALPESDQAFESMRELGRAIRVEYGEEVPEKLERWSKDAVDLFFALDRLPVRTRDLPDIEGSLIASLASLRRDCTSFRRSWHQNSGAAAETHWARLQRFVETLRLANPKADHVHDAVRRYPDALVVCSNESWSALCRTGLPASNRHACEMPVDWEERPIVYFEWPQSRRVAKVLLPPVGSPAVFVFYRWASESAGRVVRERMRRAREHWCDDCRWQAVAGPPVHSIQAKAAEAVARSRDDVDWLVEPRASRLARIARDGAQGEERTDARLVLFAGDRYAFFERDHEVVTATHIVDQLVAERAELRTCTAADLQSGDVVVVIEGSDRDVLRDRADERLAPGVRSKARTWHRALIGAVSRFGSEQAMCTALIRCGCSVTEQTIRAWIRSRWQIGPANDKDLEVIARVTKDPDLSQDVPGCRRAIALVRSEHLIASQELARRVVDRVRAALNRGIHMDEAVLLDDQIAMLTVERVEPELVSVPVSSANRVRVLS